MNDKEKRIKPEDPKPSAQQQANKIAAYLSARNYYEAWYALTLLKRIIPPLIKKQFETRFNEIEGKITLENSDKFASELCFLYDDMIHALELKIK